LVTFLLLAGSQASGGTPEPLRIGGSGSPSTSITIIARAFQKSHPNVKVEILPGLGSSGGLKALTSGALHIALISRRLTDEERKQGLLAVHYARTPFVFATSRTTRTAGITLQEAASIYAGRKTTWPDGSLIRLVLRPEVDSETALLKSLSPAMEEAVKKAFARPGMLIAITDIDAADALGRLPGSFGTTTMSIIIAQGRPIKVLSLDGAFPSLTGLADGSYPYSKSFYLVTTAQASPLAKEFMAFVRSSHGAKLLTASGHLVVDDPR
jgi:phosphate transport system substrate-binding protein